MEIYFGMAYSSTLHMFIVVFECHQIVIPWKCAVPEELSKVLFVLPILNMI